MYKNLVALFFIVVLSKAQAQVVRSNSYAPPVATSKRIDNITLYSDLRYGPIPDSINTPSSDRLLDLYLPARSNEAKSVPVLLFIHGGGFSGGSKAVTDFCVAIASNGYAVASINYRLLLKDVKVAGASCAANMAHGLPANGKFHPLLENAVKRASEDASMALSWLSHNSSTYHLDMNHLAVCGGSAGAMTALYLAYVAKPSVNIKAVVDLWGGLENAQLIDSKAPPVLIFHGDRDDVISVEYAQALYKRMQEINSPNARLVILEGKGHAQYKYIVDTKVPDIITFLNKINDYKN